MKKYTKHLWLVAFLLLFFQLPAQVIRQYKPKKERTQKALALEKEIQAFIDTNINKYDLMPERMAQLKENAELEKNEHGHTRDNFAYLLLSVKKQELRKLYLKRNPNNELSYKTALDTLPEEPVYICDNGSFEDGVTDDYSFRYSNPSDMLFLCDLDASGLSGFMPSLTVNLFDNDITLVNDDNTVSGGFDPTLHGMFVNGDSISGITIDIPRVFDGHTAIKLNRNHPGYGVATMSKTFIVNSNYVSYNFSLIIENPIDHNDYDQPHFIVRLYDSNNRIVNQNCIIADVNNTPFFHNSGNSTASPLLYTGWQCAKLSTEDAEIGDTMRLEFIITDCGLSGHYGTVYIDNICSGDECETVFGEVKLDIIEPELRDCPELPMQICGTFNPPQSINTTPVIIGELTGLTLDIIEGNNVNTTSDVVIDHINNTFCFEIGEEDFGNTMWQGFDLRANATFSIGTYNNYTISDTSSNIGDDITFNNCGPCPDCIDIITNVSGTVDGQQAIGCINASNTISASTGSSALYHAGREVLLLPGFTALKGSTDRFYIQTCPREPYVARTAAPTKPVEQPKEITIDLIERTVNSAISIYPNPTSGELTVVSGGASIKTLTVLSLEGKVILRQPAAEASSYQLNLNALSAGIYLLSVEGADGTVTSHKVIKN